MDKFLETLRTFWDKTAPFRRVVANIFIVIWKILRGVCVWIYRLRSVFFAVPVALAALRLAAFNRENLPEMVGIDLQASGQFAQLFERETAVMWPLMLTAGCLLLMCLSRRIIYPWIISIFTLAVPILIYVTNVFPA